MLRACFRASDGEGRGAPCFVNQGGRVSEAGSKADRDLASQDQSSDAGRAALQGRLAAIINSSDDGIVSKDLNGIVQSWNEAAQRIFGYTADEIVGQSIKLLIPPD